MSLQECAASNDAGSVSHAARIRIKGPPTIRSMEDAMAVSGRTFSLDCPYAGFPITAVFWEKGMSLPLLLLSTLSLPIALWLFAYLHDACCFRNEFL